MKSYNPFHRTSSLTMAVFVILALTLLVRQDQRFARAASLAALTVDTIATSTIANLAASAGGAPGVIELSWVAPGDDATAGTAAAYIVRSNNMPITESNWAVSTDVSGEPTPQPAGSVENMVVSGLLPGRYYFAIQAQDEASTCR